MSESASESVHQSKCIKKRRAQELTMANCVTRLKRGKQLLRKCPQSAVDFMFISDEKIFMIAPPVNLQNDRVYTPRGIMKRDIAAYRLLCTRPTFSKSVMVSVAISKLGCTQLIFLWNQVWKWIARTTVMCYCLSTCFLGSVSWRERCTCSSRTMHQSTAHV